MKTFALFLLIAVNVFCHAQNWNPFPNESIVHFAIDNKPFPEITIHSTDSISGDTIRFNTTFERCYNCVDTTLFLRYQPFFLGYQMINYGDTNFVFQGKDTFQINPNYQVNDSWMFTNSVMATIITYEEDVIIDVVDSVKIIALSSGETIKISKNFGILQFPILGTTETYDLIGIEDVIGFQDFDFWSVYDFDVGNIYSYENQSFIGNQSTGPEFNQWYSSTLIYGKTQTPMGYSYVISDNGFEVEYLVNNNEVSNYAGSYGLTNQGYGNLTSTFFKTRYTINSEGDVVKHFGEDNIPGHTNFTPNVLRCMNNDTCISNPANAYVFFEYRQKLGATQFSFQTFESSKSSNLIGYVLNGDTTGTIISPIRDFSKHSIRIHIAPNPTSNAVKISVHGLEKFHSSDQIEIEIYDMVGRLYRSLVIGENNYNEIIDVSKWSKGNYIIVLSFNGVPRAREKLIIF